MADEQTKSATNPIELATELTIAWLNNPNVRVVAEDVPAFLKSIHATIGELSSGGGTATEITPEYTPAVPVRSSVKPDYLVSLIDGRKLKSLKRHLASHGLTPAEYRERYGLKPDYPMTASNYSAKRREVAQRLGLGRKASVATPAPAEPAAKAPRKPVKPKAGAARQPARRTRAKADATSG